MKIINWNFHLKIIWICKVIRALALNLEKESICSNYELFLIILLLENLFVRWIRMQYLLKEKIFVKEN